MASEQVLSLARQYKQVLTDAKIPFTSVILFGSAVRGTMHEGSDIDIAVVGMPFGTDRMTEMHEL